MIASTCFASAAGSAAEIRGHLLTAEAWDWIRRTELEAALDHADHVLAIVSKLIR